jgi:hypothetical protein
MANLPADEQDWHNADQFAAWLRKRADENRRVAALPPDQWPRSPSLLQHLAHRFEQGAAIVEQLEAARKRDFEQALANGTRALRYREALQEIASYPPGTLRPLADEIAIHRLAIEALGSRSAVETSVSFPPDMPMAESHGDPRISGAPETTTERREWDHVRSVLVQAQNELQSGGARYSWMDGAIDIARARAQVKAGEEHGR